MSASSGRKYSASPQLSARKLCSSGNVRQLGASPSRTNLPKTSSAPKLSGDELSPAKFKKQPAVAATGAAAAASKNGSSSCSSSTCHQSTSTPSAGKSRWQKLFSALKKGKGAGDESHEDTYRLKHSHNCSNEAVKAGISNMKGYKKTNQDR